MSTTERLVKFDLLGQEFSFYTAEPEGEMERILTLLREIVEQDSETVSGAVPRAKVAVLGCLTLASKYVKLENEYEQYKKDSTNRLTQLSEEIFRSLEK